MSKGGLEDIVVGDSAICSIDGAAGLLRYCGYSVGQLAEHSSFVETASLLWHGELPAKSELDALETGLRSRRALSPEATFLLHGLATRANPMDALRTLVSALSAEDATLEGNALADIELSKDRAIRLTAVLPTMVANYARVRDGKTLVPPDPELGLAANFLYMLRGELPSDEEAHIFDQCLVLHAEHGFNASTYAARVVASTLTDMYAAITGAIGSLKGPLHGGANTRVMRMLLEIGDVDKAEAWIEAALASKRRVMGFGHRVYKTVDPRAVILKSLSERLATIKNEPRWFELSRAVERLVGERKGLVTNVDFYSASTYYYLGIDPGLFTPIFAMSRIAGWTAHVLEQFANNRLVRPRANWIGPDPRDYVPLEQR